MNWLKMRYKIIVQCMALTLLTSCSCIHRWKSARDTTFDGIYAYCFEHDNAKRLEILLDDGFSLNNWYDYMGNYDIPPANKVAGRTLVQISLLAGATNCTELLLSRNADVSIPDVRGTTTLMYCSCLPDNSAVYFANKIMELHPFDVNATNLLSETALCKAVRQSKVAFARWLLDRGANYNVIVSGSGPPSLRIMAHPLYFEAVNSSRAMYSLIMSLPRIDILAHDAVGRGVLSWLSPRHADYCTRFEDLISRGAEAMYSGRGYGILEWNLIMMKDKDRGDRIDFLLRYDMAEADVVNAIDLAKRRGFNNIMKKLEEYRASRFSTQIVDAPRKRPKRATKRTLGRPQ